MVCVRKCKGLLDDHITQNKLRFVLSLPFEQANAYTLNTEYLQVLENRAARSSCKALINIASLHATVMDKEQPDPLVKIATYP